MSNQSPIFIKTEAFTLWMLHHVKGFPRQERFRLVARIETVLFLFHESLMYAVKSNEPLRYLQKADAELDMLRTYIRYAVELRYTSPETYAYIAEQTTEIGRLLGGWMRKASSG